MRYNPSRPGIEYAPSQEPLPSMPGRPGGVPPPQVSQISDGIQPFCVSGGSTYFLTRALTGFLPIQDGVQLVASCYVPAGKVAFVKSVMCAPLMPAVFVDPFTSSGITGGMASWRQFARPAAFGTALAWPAQAAGPWTIPMGWENYFNNATATLPRWTWNLRMVQGNLDNLRIAPNIPPFDTAVPSSWIYVPNIPVPRTAYPAGLPGQAVGPNFDGQRVQCAPGAELNCHVLIPENMTVMLWAEWNQEGIAPEGDSTGGPIAYGDVTDTTAQFPILPSVGRLLGYMQPVVSPASIENARVGWGG